MSQSTAFRKVAAGSALALAAAGTAFIASPASAATSGPLDYTCATALGDKTFSVSHSVPDTVQYGGTVAVVSTMTVPDDVRGALYGFLNVREVEGTATNYAKALGAPVSVDQTIPATTVPADATPFVLNATGVVDLAPFAAFTPAGTAIPVSVYDRMDGETDVADAIVRLTYTYADGTQSQEPSVINCEIGDNADHAVGTVTVVEAVTETTAKISYKAGKVVNKALVDAPASGAAASGDVKFVLKRNGNKVGSKTVALTDEVAVWKVAAPKKGNYKLVTKYLGDSNFTASQDDATKSY